MWISVRLEAASERAEALSDALMHSGALSVTVEDADAGTDAEQPQFGEPGHHPTRLWQRSRLVALFEAGANIATCVREAATEVGMSTDPAYTTTEIAEQNWVSLTQSQFDPIRISDTLWIVPSWHETPDPEAINIRLDPGMAFGTGSHPTTHLCLRWLCDTVTPDTRVLDYGCGSGILGIAAARLGAYDVLGVDIDDKAVEAAQQNITDNAVRMRVQTCEAPLTQQFDIIVANILTNPLCLLAPLLGRHLAPGGRIALAGVLASQADQVIAAYAPFVRLQRGAELDGWVRLEGRSEQP